MRRTRRNYGMGSVFKKGDRWALVHSLGPDPKRPGHYRQRWTYFPCQAEARAAQKKLAIHTFGGGKLPPVGVTLGQYLERWLTLYTGHLAPTTRKSYEETIRGHLIPSLGTVHLVRVTQDRIQQYLVDKQQAGLSPTSVRYHGTLLRQILRQAVRNDELMRDPMASLKLPRRSRKELQVLDDEQTRLFLAEAKRSSRYYRLYLAAILTGLREGELLGLRWQDMNLALGQAAIQQTFYRLSGAKKRGGNPLLFKAPKTARSRRQVDLPPVLVEELRTEREVQKERRRLLGAAYATDLDLVFCQENGKPLHIGNLTRRDFRQILALEALRKDLRANGVSEDALPKGLPQIRFHDLRHGCATLLLQQGVHPKVVQEMLGHTAIGVTMDTYSHVLPGIRERVAQALEARLLAALPPSMGGAAPKGE